MKFGENGPSLGRCNPFGGGGFGLGCGREVRRMENNEKYD